MRAPVLCIVTCLVLTSACIRGSAPSSATGPARASAVRVYNRTVPRCPVREVGPVQGRTIRELQQAAMRLRADAVLMDPFIPGPRGTVSAYTGTAVVHRGGDRRDVRIAVLAAG